MTPDHLQPSPRYVGQRIPPRDGRRLVAGGGRYVADVRLPGLRHVAFVRSPHAHARIVSVDATAAQALNGVHQVLLASEALQRATPFRAALNEFTPSEDEWVRACDWPCMAADRVTYVGEIVAAVVADDRYLAEDAAELLRVEYEPLPAAVDLEHALQPGAPQVRDDVPGNLLCYKRFQSGDVDAAFARAALVVRDRFQTSRISAAPMEGRGVVAQYDRFRGDLTVWISSQAPHLVRTTLADVLDLPADRVRVIAPDVGGGFGAKYPLFPEEVLVSLLALRSDAPVAWTEDRREHLLASPHARGQVHDAELAVDGQGRILAVRDRYLVDVGAYSVYPQTGSLETFQTGALLLGPYDVQTCAWEARGVMTNKAPWGAFRSISRPVGNFVLESLLGRAARALGVDSVEVRRRNLVQPDAFPYRTAAGMVIESGSYVQALDLLERMADPPTFRREQHLAREEQRYLGIGFGCFNELAAHGSQAVNVARGHDNFTGYDSAVVTIDTSGHLNVALGVTSQGQGHDTVFAQVLADEFGVDLSQVSVREGDTATTPFGMGAFGSRSAVVAGGAIRLAAARLREKVLRIAAHLLEAGVDDLELADGRVGVRGVPERRLTLKQISRVAYFNPTKLPKNVQPQLVETAAYDPPPGTWSNGCQAAVVEVFPETGEVRLLRYYAVEDCGPAINPLVVDGQVMGGVAQGIGQALLEELRYDADGQLLSGSLMDYLLPTAMDVPPISLDHLSTPSPYTIGGFKGAGEGGPINPPAAIANAVADALAPLEPQLTETPFTPERVLEALRRAAGPSAAGTLTLTLSQGERGLFFPLPLGEGQGEGVSPGERVPPGQANPGAPLAPP